IEVHTVPQIARMCKALAMQVPLPADADKRANLAAAGTGSGQCVEGVSSGSAPIWRLPARRDRAADGEADLKARLRRMHRAPGGGGSVQAPDGTCRPSLELTCGSIPLTDRAGALRRLLLCWRLRRLGGATHGPAPAVSPVADPCIAQHDARHRLLVIGQ